MILRGKLLLAIELNWSIEMSSEVFLFRSQSLR